MRFAPALLAAVLLTACAADRPQAHPGAPQSTPAAARADASEAPVTILISIDAFRPDYLRQGRTPALDRLAAEGTTATMRPSFPSLTFPNHYTLVTGLRPDHHGIVANIMHDPRRPGERFYNKDPNSADPFWWGEAEPIWITAERAGLRTATMFWPGEEVPHDGIRPRDWWRFDAAITSQQRALTVIDWLRRPPATRPRFITLYFDEVDRTSHTNGPLADATWAAVSRIDALIGIIDQAARDAGVATDLVIVSDHGMRAIEPDRATYLKTLLPAGSYTLLSWGPVASIEPTPGNEAVVGRILEAPHPDMDCWAKPHIPGRYHLGVNPRVAPFVCLAHAGGEVVDQPPTNKGDHGYDIDDPEMTALFLVHGPSFRPGARIPQRFDNVDLYPLLARLIGVDPLPNDGDARVLQPLLDAPQRR